ncbi:MAG: hypothetical protein C4303_10370 [candidate division GAL15 bacterium]
MLSALPEAAGAAPPPDAHRTMEELSQHAHAAYRKLVWEEPGFVPFFRQFTPIDELSLLQIASRPPARPEGGDFLHSLRAIPWVFAWTQTRTNLPGWYGLGSALDGFARETPGAMAELRAMYAAWPFFRSVVDNAQISLGTADLEVARLYAELVDEPVRERLYCRIREEYEVTVQRVLELTGQRELLDNSPILQRSVRLRNPYVDPISYLQVRLLRERRAHPEDPQVAELLHRTVNGIAAGLQTTG